jgi:O-acetyl-ADP-ribose deacetylase (regulator of RNase III)
MAARGSPVEARVTTTESVNGNVLDADVDAVVNPVNCAGVMGKGLALQFKKKYPDVFREYARACRSGEVVPGRMHIVERGSAARPRFIVNFPTKRHWRDASRIEDIERGLEALVAEIQVRRIGSIAVPALGCGLGGLDWAEVRPLIVRAFALVRGVRLEIYEPGG